MCVPRNPLVRVKFFRVCKGRKERQREREEKKRERAGEEKGERRVGVEKKDT